MTAAVDVTVQPGDWLSKIAPKYSETWQQLYQDNKSVVGSNPNLIFPGQVLVVHPGTGSHRAADSPDVTVHPAAGNAAGGTTSGTSAAQAAVAFAKAQIGKPYLYGGNGPAAFDCSGLTSQAYLHAGISIPRTADEQWKGLPHVSLSALHVGDLIAFGYNAGYADHVAIYVGGGMIIDTSTHRPNGGVAEQSLASRWAGGSWHPLGGMRPSGGVHAAVQAPPKNTSAPVIPPIVTLGGIQGIAQGIFGSQYSCAANIIQNESGWDPRATNPSSGAYGLPQALPGNKMASAGADWATNPTTQLRWMKSYVDSVYGGACAAWAHWQGAQSY
jgi:cell wall-associated NlpC family hydrolase